jgi:hypothetical protein
LDDVTPPPSPSLLEALSEADWGNLLPRLVGYAEIRLRRVGWAHGEDHEPNRISVMGAINIAIDRCMTGQRRWNDDDPPELGAFLCGVIKSIISDEFKKSKRDPVDLAGETIVEHADPTSSGVRVADEDEAEKLSAVCAAIEACAHGDEDLEMFRLAVLEGEGNVKRESIAATLDWTPERVTAARVKLQRRLIKKFPAEFAAAKKKRRAS